MLSTNHRRTIPSAPSLSARSAVRAAAVAVLAMAVPAFTATLTWDPTLTNSTAGGGAGTWDKTLANWHNGVADVAWTDGNTAVFANSGGAVPLGVPISALNLQLTGTGYTIAPTSPNTLTLSALTTTGLPPATIASAAVYATGAINTISGALVLVGSATANTTQTLAAAPGAVLNLIGTIALNNSTTSGAFIAGGGTVNYGGTSFTAGRFNVGGGTVFNSSGTMSGFQQTSTGVSSLTPGSAWNVNSGSNISAATTLFLGNGTGTSGTFNMVGGTATFSSGTINIGDGANNDNAGTGVLNITGGTLSTGTTSGAIRIGNANKGGFGTLNLNGGILATNSVIQLGSSTFGGSGGSAALNFNGGTLQATGLALTVSNTLTGNIQDNGLFVDTNNGSANIAANLSGVGGILKIGTGVLTLGGTNTFGGFVSVANGALAVTDPNAIPDFSGVGVSSGAYLSFGVPAFIPSGINTARSQATFAPNSGIGLDVATGTQSYAGNLTNAAPNFIKTGTGTLTLTGSNTYTGTTLVAAGVLGQPSRASLGTTTGLLLGYGLSTGTFQYTGLGETWTLPISINGTTGGATLDASGGGAFVVSGPVGVGTAGVKTLTLTGTSTAANTITSTFGNGAGTLGLAKSGAGTWVLTGNNSFGGAVAINAGTLIAASSTALGTGAITVAGAGSTTPATGGTLALTGGVTLANVLGNFVTRNDPDGTLSTPHLLNQSGNNQLNGNITVGTGGTGLIVRSDGGTLTLAGSITNTSNTAATARPIYIVGNGDVTLSGNLLAGTGNTATVATNGLSIDKRGNGTLLISGAANTFFQGIAIKAGTVALATTPGTGPIANGGSLSFVNAAALAVPNTISGTGTVTQAGTGLTLVTGPNTYTGVTTVQRGTLELAANAQAPVLTNAGGADIQTGQVNFDYTTTSPVTTIRNLLAASFTAADGSPGVMDTGRLRSTTSTAARGLGYADTGTAVIVKATLFGDADLDGGVSINDFNAFAANFGATSGKVWSGGDFDYDGGVSINDFNLFAGNFGQTLPAGAAAWTPLLAFAAAHDDLVAFEAVTGVPEPTGLGLLAACATLGLRRRSRDAV